MGIDGCEHSFEELAVDVFPAYMEELRSKMSKPIPLSDFAVKGDGPTTLSKRYGYVADPSGCYALIGGSRPVYVGISKHVFERIREHVLGSDHFTASLAYRIAYHRYPFQGTARDAMQDVAFHHEFEKARAQLQSMSVAVMEISNPLELYLFEAYCAMELDTGVENGGWNTFRTH